VIVILNEETVPELGGWIGSKLIPKYVLALAEYPVLPTWNPDSMVRTIPAVLAVKD
jgi:hypothetical protein